MSAELKFLLETALLMAGVCLYLLVTRCYRASTRWYKPCAQMFFAADGGVGVVLRANRRGDVVNVSMFSEVVEYSDGASVTSVAETRYWKRGSGWGGRGPEGRLVEVSRTAGGGVRLLTTGGERAGGLHIFEPNKPYRWENARVWFTGPERAVTCRMGQLTVTVEDRYDGWSWIPMALRLGNLAFRRIEADIWAIRSHGGGFCNAAWAEFAWKGSILVFHPLDSVLPQEILLNHEGQSVRLSAADAEKELLNLGRGAGRPKLLSADQQYIRVADDHVFVRGDRENAVHINGSRCPDNMELVLKEGDVLAVNFEYSDSVCEYEMVHIEVTRNEENDFLFNGMRTEPTGCLPLRSLYNGGPQPLRVANSEDVV